MEDRSDPLQRALSALAVAAWAGVILWAVLHRQDYTLEHILDYTPESPLLAAAVLMVLFAFKSLSVVFYSGLLYAAAGVLFPLPAAILVNLCGTAVMAAVPYLLARRVGARRADALRGKHPRLRQFERIRTRNPLAFAVVLRCVNVISFDVGSMYCGAVRLAPAPFLLGSLLGKLGDLTLWSVMGATLDEGSVVPILVMYAVDLAIALAVSLWIKKQNERETSGPQA